jgi:hypothetical protein
MRELLDARPFVPLRIHLSDGKVFEIRHPDFVWVLRSRLDIAVPAEGNGGFVDHVEHCSLLHIVRVEELSAASAP